MAMMSFAAAMLMTASLGVVKSYDRPILHVYNGAGVMQGARPKESLPKLPAPIQAMNAKNEIGVQDGSSMIFLRNAEITTDGVPPRCQPLEISVRKSTDLVAGTVSGDHSGVSAKGEPCIGSDTTP